MQKRKKLLFFCLVALILILSACGKSNDTDNAEKQENMEGMNNSNMDMKDSPTSNSSSNESSSNEVNVIALNWEWQLSKTAFKVGEPVTFSIEGKEGVHGFSIKGTNINEQVAAGETKKVTWTPDKAGEYIIECSVVCGTGHSDMVQTITVK